MSATIQPVALGTANRFVRAYHRHSRPVIGHLFSLGLFGDDLTLHGVAIVGRPVARALDDGRTVEVTRLATDGTRNACSRLETSASIAAVSMADGSPLPAGGWAQRNAKPTEEDQ